MVPAAGESPTLTRRRALAAAAGATLAGTSGCLKELRNILSRDGPDRVTLEIKTLPADSDPFAIHVARSLAENLRAAGVEARVTPMSREELFRQVLLNHSFDIYVGQFPADELFDPNRFYPLLYSTYAVESGWQNPFGYVNLTADEHLEEQQRVRGDRAGAAESLQSVLDQTQPFTTVCAPDTLSAYRGDRFDGPPATLSTPVDLLTAPFDPGEQTGDGGGGNQTGDGGGGNQTGDDEDGNRRDTIRLVTTDPRVTENRNPLAVEFRHSGGLVGLLYDPLVRPYDGEWIPWLAESWTVDPAEDGTTVTATLRDATWHDGTRVTADDAAFTYRLLDDTALQKDDATVPAPRYREASGLVEEATVVDGSTLRLRLKPCNRTVAERALAVPILPREEWEPKAKPASIAGVSVEDAGTEALVWNNPEPLGSGPFAFEQASAREGLVLSAFSDHFVWDSATDLPEPFVGGPTFRRLDVRVTSSSTSAVELLDSGDADATMTPLSPAAVRQIGQSNPIRLAVRKSRAFYHVGFDTRQQPLGNPRFRRIVARLLDREHLVADVFDGYAEPVASPFAGTDWLASEFDWSADPLEFIGSDGEIDEAAAREAFRSAGFNYDDAGRLRG